MTNSCIVDIFLVCFPHHTERRGRLMIRICVSDPNFSELTALFWCSKGGPLIATTSKPGRHNYWPTYSNSDRRVLWSYARQSEEFRFKPGFPGRKPLRKGFFLSMKSVKKKQTIFLSSVSICSCQNGVLGIFSAM